MLANRLTFIGFHRVASFSLAALFIAVLGLYAGCSGHGGGPLTVPLEYRHGHSDPIAGAIAAVDVKVFLEPVKDKRDNKEAIGENIEDSAKPVQILSSGKSPTDFVHAVLEKELKGSGLDLTDAAEAADRVVSLDLTKFWVQETNTYHAEVQAIATVRDKAGSVKWKERVAGDGSTGGRSLNPENYQETLSDATSRLVGMLLNNPKFQAALTR